VLLLLPPFFLPLSLPFFAPFLQIYISTYLHFIIVYFIAYLNIYFLKHPGSCMLRWTPFAVVPALSTFWLPLPCPRPFTDFKIYSNGLYLNILTSISTSCTKSFYLFVKIVKVTSFSHQNLWIALLLTVSMWTLFCSVNWWAMCWGLAVTKISYQRNVPIK
jgi:hypothetical protein